MAFLDFGVTATHGISLDGLGEGLKVRLASLHFVGLQHNPGDCQVLDYLCFPSFIWSHFHRMYLGPLFLRSTRFLLSSDVSHSRLATFQTAGLGTSGFFFFFFFFAFPPVLYPFTMNNSDGAHGVPSGGPRTWRCTPGWIGGWPLIAVRVLSSQFYLHDIWALHSRGFQIDDQMTFYTGHLVLLLVFEACIITAKVFAG